MTEEPSMTTTSAPAFVRVSNPLSRRLLRIGTPMGPNVLLTVRGRTSGQPRSAAVAVLESEGRRYVIGAYGNVQWVRNLREAGEAEIGVRGNTEKVVARELDQTEATDFFARILPSYVRRFPWIGRAFARILFGSVAPEILDDPQRAAETRPVFELRPKAG
jgi:deazaflavin-dependent oxidoreductase (nitroreductase family)